jgi:hypothetical protein
MITTIIIIIIIIVAIIITKPMSIMHQNTQNRTNNTPTPRTATTLLMGHHMGRNGDQRLLMDPRHACAQITHRPPPSGSQA